MSRMGKKPVTIPEGVDVTLDGGELKAKGKLGELSIQIDDEVSVTIEESAVSVTPKTGSKQARYMWGTTRSLICNMVEGVQNGFTVNLEVNGVGYRAAVQGKELVMQLGFSHEVRHPIPDDITIKCEKPTMIALHGINKQRVGQLAANIRGYRPPEPYKGKGIKYEGEYIFRKEGKKK